MTDDSEIRILSIDRPTTTTIRSRTMLLMHEELARARVRDLQSAAELRPAQLPAGRRRPRRSPAAALRARLALRPAS